MSTQKNEEKQSRGGKFLKDLGVYAIGNIGSKLITFLLIPLYTYYISDPKDFGYYDICLTIVFCFGPIVGLQLGESAFRFLLEFHSTSKRKDIISFLVKSLIRNSLIVIVISVTASLLFDIKYSYLILAFGLIQTYYDIALQVIRGLGHTKYYMTCGIVNASIIAILSFLFIAIWKLGVPGLFYANILSRTLTLIFVETKLHIIKSFFSTAKIDKETSSQMLRYSLPLLPAIIIWWILSSNNVFFIQYFLGLEENGIYAMLAKFSGILYILSLIFYQTWQQNAIEEYNSPNRDRFFSQVFNSYLFLLCGLIIFFSFGLRLNYEWLIGFEYRRSGIYLFANSIYIAIYALALFYELGYQCSKNTDRILPSFILITIIGISLNYLLTKPLGIYGVIISNIITYSVLLVYRAIDTRKYMHISFDFNNLKAIALVVFGGVLYYYNSSTIFDLAAIVLLGSIYILICPIELKHMILKRFKPSRA